MGNLNDTVPHAEGDAPAPGGTVGRFAVLGLLGQGGMGVVLSAHDPVLDRNVAIKLLRPRAWGTEEEAALRLQREAQAMARLAHPNVVHVYEVGTVGSQPFVAMELVEGRTLHRWLDERPRSWSEKLAMFAAAGRGLSAVHAAGIVHRDFKPENVLVGTDERPRVTDFGLVAGAPDTPGNSALSVAASAVGTLAYMAPEQLQRLPSDARSDQFAFCVALWEALWGAPPFPPDAPPELRKAPPAPPRGKAVPAWLFPLVARGLASRPEQRWPSLQTLLHALARDPGVARRRWLIGGGALLLVGAAAVAIKLDQDLQSQRCTAGAAGLSGVWDAEHQARIEAAFVKAGPPHAAQSWQRARAVLDGYAHRWAAAADEACRATHVDGRQSEALLDLRMACLARRRATLRALGETWTTEVSAQSIENAASTAASLPPVEECGELETLAATLPLPRDPQLRARISAVRSELDRAQALLASSDWTGTRKLAERASVEATTIGYPPLEAEAKFVLGTALNLLVEPGNGEDTLLEAAHLAGQAHDDRLAALSLIAVVTLEENTKRQPDKGLLLSRAAEAAVARAGDSAELRGRLLLARGNAYLDAGQYADAKQAMTQAKALLVSALGPDAALTLRSLTGLANVADEMGDYRAARAAYHEVMQATARIEGPDSARMGRLYSVLGEDELNAGLYPEAESSLRQAVAILERRLGPRNEPVAEASYTLCTVLTFESRHDDAAAACERALAIFEEVNGPDSQFAGNAAAALAQVRMHQGRAEDAFALYRRALAIGARSYGREHSKYGVLLRMYGLALGDKGDPAVAQATLREALTIFQKTLGPNHTKTLDVMTDVAELDVKQGRCAEARPNLELARSGLEHNLGPVNRHLVYPLVALAKCDLAAGRARQAVALIERALAIDEKEQDPAQSGADRFTLARALFELGDKQRALDEARRAEPELVQGGADGAEELTQLRTWLAGR